KTCPVCRRTVPDQATVCPHPGCGKPLVGQGTAATSIKRPPPPGPVRVSPAAAPVQAPARPAAFPASRTPKEATYAAPSSAPATPSSAPAREREGRWLLFILSLLVLIVFGTLAGYSVWRRGGTVAQSDALGGAAPKKQSDADSDRAAQEDNKDRTNDQADSAKESSRKGDGSNDTGKGDAESPGEPTGDGAQTSDRPSEPEVLGLYSLRTAPKREELVAQLGGTPASEAAVALGLEWLARHQSEGGHWGPDCLGNAPQSRCEKPHVCEGFPGGPYEAALTGLALLALQAGGHYDFNEHTYSSHVAKGLHCLVEQQGLDGELVGSQNVLADKPGMPHQYDHAFMYEHAIATFALAEACAVARASGRHPDSKLLEAAIKAEKFIEAQQHSDGGWRYTSNLNEPSDCSISGWAMLALKSCREAGITVSEPTVSRMVQFFKRQSDPLTGRTHYQTPNFGTDALTGVGMLVDQFVLHQSSSPLNTLAAPYLADMAEKEWGDGNKRNKDYYLWYNCTLAMYQAGGEPWERWNKVVREMVLSLQVHGESCDRGSWVPDDQWSVFGGRVYSTALATLTLEVYYRFAKQTNDEAVEK
ncbi:MAG TPA: hypothetical protein VGX76_12570, partial [Pirellulales bacterium]|nr:hypothetical protein [Pirellulales bacterium]